MIALIILIPVAMLLGLAGLLAFLWALRSGQFDDLDGAAVRILGDDDRETPVGWRARTGSLARAKGAGLKDLGTDESLRLRRESRSSSR